MSAAHSLEAYGFVPPTRDELAAAFLGEPSDLGQDPSDFSGLPTVAQQAWPAVANQLLAEGVNPNDNGEGQAAFQAAQEQFATAYNDMTQQMGVTDYAQAAQGAAQYVLAGKTVAGAVQTVTGLISQAQGINSVQAATTFVGSFFQVLVTASIGAGVVSAGVGAAIMVGIGVALEVIQSAFPGASAPAGQLVCSNGSTQIYCAGATFSVGCLCCVALTAEEAQSPISPGTTEWRNFPSPTLAADAAWFLFVPFSSTSSFLDPLSLTSSPQIGTPNGVAKWGNAQWSGGYPGQRPIDSAFPDYHQLECDQATPFGGEVEPCPAALVDFTNAFFSAWKANRAFALNGLTPLKDELVLLQTIATFNRAYSNSSTYELTADTTNAQPQLPPSIDQLTGAIMNPTPATPYVPFIKQLAYAAIGDSSSKNLTGVLNAAGTALVINTGPKKQPPVASPLLASAAASSSTSSAGTVAAVAIGGTAIAGGLWLALGRPMTLSAIRAALGGL